MEKQMFKYKYVVYQLREDSYVLARKSLFGTKYYDFSLDNYWLSLDSEFFTDCITKDKEEALTLRDLFAAEIGQEVDW
jgi:hypothetical protein